MIEFPTYVDIVAQTYNVEHTSTTLRSDFESGFAKQRQAYCLGFKRINFDILVSGHKKQDFIDWYNTTGRGALWFKFIDPETESETRARFTSFNLSFSSLDTQLRKWRASISLEVFDA